MMTINRNDALLMTGAALAGLAPGMLVGSPVAGLGGALIAGGAAAAGRVFLRRRQEEPEAKPLELDLHPMADNTELLATLGRDIARAERYGEAFTITLVKAEGYDEMTPAAREAVGELLKSSVERVTRASDSWHDLGNGRLAVLLERCTSSEAASFGERVSIAANSRPLIAEGSRIPITILVANTQYDAHQFVGAQDFFAAATNARFAAPGTRKRLVSDGRKLREQIYGKDRSAGAA